MIDARREAALVFKQYDRYHRTVGESVLWMKFDLASSYDRVYDEGGREYQPAVPVPALWVDQIEPVETYSDSGRRPTNRVRAAFSIRSLRECGIDTTEASGGRVWDAKPDKPWWDDRTHDLVYYDGRFYEVSNFQIRGRLQSEDVVVGVSGIETQPDDDRVWDLLPGEA